MTGLPEIRLGESAVERLLEDVDRLVVAVRSVGGIMEEEAVSAVNQVRAVVNGMLIAFPGGTDP